MAQLPRATRFPVVSRLLWRPHLRYGWHDAWSVNASESGVLFRFERAPDEQPPVVGTPLDMIFGLSWESRLMDSADIQCSGRVVRTEEGDPGEALIAATIDHYALLKSR